MKNQNTNNATEKKATTKKSTLQAVKREKSVLVFDDVLQRMRLYSVTSENKTSYETADKTKIEKEKCFVNVSKNQYALHEDKKKYLSHVNDFADVHDLETFVSTVYIDACSTQYYIFCLNRTAKLRIQKNNVEILANCLESYENSRLSTKQAENEKRYKYTVDAHNKNEILTILKYIEENK